MHILVDTCIWSLALRRNSAITDVYSTELIELIKEFRAYMIGPIRQEVLSGIKNFNEFDLLRKKIASFEDLKILTIDYEKAAEYFNLTRAKGIQGSMIDFLICAVAYRYQMSIYTTDKDFLHYQEHIPIFLHKPRT